MSNLQLLIVRHAKADQSGISNDDFDRPLTSRGISNASEMAERLKSKQIIPNLIVSSPALRAITTANLMANVFSINSAAIILDQDIYEASSKTLLSVINKIDEGYKLVAIFGHNPGLSDLVSRLSDSEMLNLPTCGMALISFESNTWNEISFESGKLEWIDYPKNI